MPILLKYGVSPDAEWVTAAVAYPSEPMDSPEAAGRIATVAIAVHGGAVRRLCGVTCPSGWSADGKFLWVGGGRNTWVVPVASGRSMPELPDIGLDGSATVDQVRGARIINHGAASPGPGSSTYVFEKTELHANLFRIALR